MNCRGFKRVFFGEIEKSVGKLYLVHLSGNQLAVAQYRTADLKAVYVFLDNYFVIVAERGVYGGYKLVFRADLADSVGRAGLNRFYIQRVFALLIHYFM